MADDGPPTLFKTSADLLASFLRAVEDELPVINAPVRITAYGAEYEVKHARLISPCTSALTKPPPTAVMSPARRSVQRYGTIVGGSTQGLGRTTKTGKARIVPMIPKVAEALEEHRKRLVREQNPGLREGIVFPANNGARRTASCIHKTTTKLAEACGIDVKVGPQVLCKTFITLMGIVGVRREMVKAISGHATDEMHDHYTNIRPEDRRVAVSRFFGEESG